VADPFIIEAADLRKSYEGVEALRGVDLQVPRGSICGFLGRNGAGKTTTIKLLLGMARPSGGRISAFGLAADRSDASIEIRRRTGFVSEDKDLYTYMTVDEIIRFTAAFYPRWRRDLEQRYRDMFDLPAGRKVKALSLGTRTKLALLLALSRGAELLVLDEPTSGLDPAVAEEVLQALVSHVAREEITVFFRRIKSPKSIRLRIASRSSIAAARQSQARSTTSGIASGASNWFLTVRRQTRPSVRQELSACSAKAAC